MNHELPSQAKIKEDKVKKVALLVQLYLNEISSNYAFFFFFFFLGKRS